MRIKVRTGEAGAAQRLEQELLQLLAEQVAMKQVNTILRKHFSAGIEVQRKALIDHGVGGNAERLLHPPFSYMKQGYQGYELSNLSGRIKAKRKQLETAKDLAVQVTTEELIGQVTRINNVEEDRLQLKFPTMPSEAIRYQLSHSGFRWSPTNDAWQALRGKAADYKASLIINAYNKEHQA